MKATAKRTEVVERVGICPGCGDPIEAELSVVTTIGDVTIDDEGNPSAEVESHVRSVRVVHRCEPEPPAPATGGDA